MQRFLSYFMPERASDLSHSVDALYFTLTALCGAVAAVVCILVVFFSWRYRRGSSASRAQHHGWFGSLLLETGWTLTPLIIFVGIFIWAAEVYARMARPPANATEIYVVAKQWMWKTQHLDGRREINELHLPVGQPVKLLMTSQDVIHDFFVPAFRTKQDVLPDRYTVEWFTPIKPGRYHLFCAEYCGTNHSTMGGWVYVMAPQDYARWLDQGTPGPLLINQGAQLYQSLGCSGCHGPSSQVHAPRLEGLFGRPAPLQDGSFAMADDQYLRDSILLPNRQIAAGYQPLMPTYQGKITDEDLNALVAYLKSLATSPDPHP